MKNERILNNLGQVDEKYIMESAPKKNKNKNGNLLTWVSMVACLCIVAGSVFAVFKMIQNPKPQDKDITNSLAANYIVINEIGVPSNADMDVIISSYISDGVSDISKKDWDQTILEFKRLTGITYDDFKEMIPSNWEIESFLSMSSKVYEDDKYMIHDFVLTYRTENNSTARISFCPFEAPLKDLFVMCDNPKQSEINGVPVTIYGYDNCYIAQFSYNNSNYDIETKDATEEELETLLASIISK